MLTFTLLLFFISRFQNVASDIKKCAIEYAPDKDLRIQIREYILNNYSQKAPNASCIVLTLDFTVIDLKVSETEEFSVLTWVHIFWTNERLIWNPDDYKNTDEITVDGISIWLPYIEYMNSICDTEDIYRYLKYATSIPCTVTFEGHVVCSFKTLLKSKCATDLNNWPYDKQVCSLQFRATDLVSKKKINLRFVGDTQPVDKNTGEWIMVHSEQEENVNDKRQLIKSFHLVRKADVIELIVVSPLPLLSLLTVSSLFLDVRCANRLYLACFSLLCHFYFLDIMAKSIPDHGKNAPKILFYYRGSIIKTTISFFLTIILNRLCGLKSPAPKIVSVTNGYIYKTYAKFLIYPRWEVVNNAELMKNWTDFASFLNSVWILITVMTYIVMYCVFVPSPISLETNDSTDNFMLNF